MNPLALIRAFAHSFPVQLVLMYVKKNQLTLLYWLLLFGFVTGNLASKFGIPYLFLDPEYRGAVGPLPFLIIGICLGAFIMAFHISGFILNSFRFPFLATMSRPFVRFVYNNMAIPLTFLLLYSWCIFRFQRIDQLRPVLDVIANLASMLFGVALVAFFTIRYFLMTNKDIFKLFGVSHSDLDDATPVRPLSGYQRSKSWKVETYLMFPFRVRRVRDTRHYKRYMLEQVFRQNHINAAVIEIIVFATFIVLGLFRENPYFRIPAGASVLLLFTMLIMISGVLRYWLRAWATTGLILFFIALNFISQFEVFNPRNQAYGLDYGKTPAEYSNRSLSAQLKDSLIDADRANTLAILERWKANWKSRGVDRPKMVLINVSGGGLRSAMFTFRTLQMIDSMAGGTLFPQSVFATGSSGGIIGLCYYRELYLNNHDSLMAANQNPDNPFLKSIGKDMLNSLVMSATVADIFLNNQQFDDGRFHYTRDRAWAWEQQLNENTHGAFDGRLGDYALPERNAEIPMVVFSPTIINDGRALHISAQPVSYLINETPEESDGIRAITSGVEFGRFFAQQGSADLRISSAVRMGATFPYITPAVSLPSSPTIEVMDAGIRDNYGIVNSVQFMHTFRDWIALNTSGVVMLQIRDNFKNNPVQDNSIKTLLEKLMAPMRNLSGNFIIMQDYSLDKELQYAQSWLSAPLDVVIFQMPNLKDRVSISWHLTAKEKAAIISGSQNRFNIASLARLDSILNSQVKTPAVP